MWFWTLIGLVSVIAACTEQGSVRVTRSDLAASSATKVSSFSPLIAKPGDTVRVNGQNFREAGEYFAVFSLEDGSIKEVKLEIIDSMTASFVMPSNLGLGERKFVVRSGDVEMGALAIHPYPTSAEMLERSARRCHSSIGLERPIRERDRVAVQI